MFKVNQYLYLGWQQQLLLKITRTSRNISSPQITSAVIELQHIDLNWTSTICLLESCLGRKIGINLSELLKSKRWSMQIDLTKERKSVDGMKERWKPLLIGKFLPWLFVSILTWFALTSLQFVLTTLCSLLHRYEFIFRYFAQLRPDWPKDKEKLSLLGFVPCILRREILQLIAKEDYERSGDNGKIQWGEREEERWWRWSCEDR